MSGVVADMFSMCCGLAEFVLDVFIVPFPRHVLPNIFLPFFYSCCVGIGAKKLIFEICEFRTFPFSILNYNICF